MATYKKLSSGKWQAQVALKGVRKAKNFNTKAEARDWVARQEYLAGQAVNTTKATLAEVLERYGREETPKKRGARWELMRIARFLRDDIELVGKPLSGLDASDFASWRDRRLKVVKPASVNREMTLLSTVLNVARREWGLIDQNPMRDVRKPSNSPPRDRRVSDSEIAALVEIAGCDLGKATARAVHAFRFAVETAMRAGEVVGLTETSVDRATRVAHLTMTKNGTARKVPLSSAALALLDQLPEADGPIFGLNSAQVDVLFRKARDRAGIENLRFHDSRHEAITRMAGKVDVLSLARIVGHKDIKMLMVYYNETAEELALRLN